MTFNDAARQSTAKPTIPIVTTPRMCLDCLAPEGEPHELSCEQVPVELWNEIVHGVR